jgi:hypothetical protein
MGTIVETAIVNYCLLFLTKENKLSFSVFVCSIQTKVCHFRLQQANETCCFPFVTFSIYVYIFKLQQTNGSCRFQFVCFRGYIYIHRKQNYIIICCRFKRNTETEAQLIFLHRFTICSSYKWKFVIFPFVDEETNRSYPFGNRLKWTKRIKWICPSMSLWC